MDSRSPDGSPIFDSLDVDIFVRVLAHTLFGPFFMFFIPIFFVFQGAKLTDPSVVYTSVYWVFISSCWFIQWCSRLYRNQRGFLFGPGRFDWGEQIVVITGGSSGVGELLANTLAVRNVTVIVLDINPIITENYNITFYKCDVSKWEEVEAVSKKITEEIGEPTILVNNAGVVQGKTILDLEPADVQQYALHRLTSGDRSDQKFRTFGVNTLAHFWTLKAFLPSMIKNKSGHIVRIPYTSSPDPTDDGSLRYKCPQIRTTLVTPGHIMTPLFQTFSVPDNVFYKFFFPTVQPVTVVKRIIAVLDEQDSQHISVPFYTNLCPYITHMPSFIRDLTQWVRLPSRINEGIILTNAHAQVSNANYAMDHFSKVSGLRPEEVKEN
ncbi:hypothetical protein DXG01_006020 [Tephrocybe rancida]|nr:hypothetical protein DXG01_006020 [Tephrocybe rancida]